MTIAAQAASFHDLATMIAYMDGQCSKINALVQEIEEIQRAFETRFVDTQEQFDNTRARLAAWVEAHGWEQPAWLAAEITERLPKVRKDKQERLTKVAHEIADLADQRTSVERQNETMISALKDNNPRLNEREEKLKQQQAETQAELDERTAQWRAAGGGLGWLLRAGQVRKLRAEAESLADRVHDLNSRLTEVRNAWASIEQKTGEQETNLQQAWRLRTAEIARLKREQTALQTDLDRVVREAALDEILNSIAQPKSGEDADFDQLLTDLVTLHDQNRDYQAGITQVAELMGIMKGVCEGLKRMEESVQGVKQEQDMHSELRDLELAAPPVALQFHTLWDRLEPIVQDEKFAAQRPRDLASRLRQTIGEGLLPAAIDAMFTALGNELDRATKEQW
jgi:uncharacterized phage infection (PIP) family protein YhgE